MICCTRPDVLVTLMGPMGSCVPLTMRNREPVMSPVAVPTLGAAVEKVVKTVDEPRVARTQARAGSATARHVAAVFT